MKLNKATSHALRVLVACERAGNGLTKVAELASELELTQQNAFKIVHLLSRAGFLESERGRYGGVRLKASADAIKVGEVVKAMELLSEQREPGADGEQHAQLFDEAFEAFVTVLNQTSIADMARVRQPSEHSGALAKPKSGKSGPKVARAAKPRGTTRTHTA